MDQKTVERLATAAADWVKANRDLHGAQAGEDAEGHVMGIMERFAAKNHRDAGAWFDAQFQFEMCQPNSPIPDPRHKFTPHRKFPWQCAGCGYPEHATLKHLATQN